jgi:hypothetical protein
LRENRRVLKQVYCLRRKTTRKLPDSIIAAAIVPGATLIIRDKHLLEIRFPGLNMVCVNKK